MGSPILPYTVDLRLMGARLCEFRTGSADLLGAHKDWITKYFVPKIRQYPNAWVDYVGAASMTGNAAANMALSQKRIAAVEQFIASQYPGLKVNVRLPQGASDAGSFQTPSNNNDGYWRAVVVKWFGIPLPIETPKYPPPEPETPYKFRTYHAPNGCWCVIGVDSFGIPIKAGVSGGKAELTLLNDKGEKWIVRGYGVGAGVGVNVGPEIAEKGFMTLLKALKEVGVKAGDIGNVSKTVKDLNLTGPNETAGGIFKRLTWAANLTIDDITGSGFFTIVNGEAHVVAMGAEIGLLFFGIVSPVAIVGAAQALTTPWGFYTSLGLGTMKAAIDVGGTTYKITSKEKQSQ